MKRGREEPESEGDAAAHYSLKKVNTGSAPQAQQAETGSVSGVSTDSHSGLVSPGPSGEAKPVEQVHVDEFDWLERYQLIAQVVKLKCFTKSTGEILDHTLPTEVAFYTKNHADAPDEDAVRTEYRWDGVFDALSQEVIEQDLEGLGIDPQLAVGAGIFDNVFEYLEGSSFRWTTRPNKKTAGWVIEEPNLDLSVFNGDEITLNLIRAFKMAYTHDMANGPGKFFMQSLFMYMKSKLASQSNTRPTFLHWAPSEGTPTNVLFEYVSENDLTWKLPYDPLLSPGERRRRRSREASGASSWSGSTGSRTRGHTSRHQTCLIPDYVVMLPAPINQPESIGEFLLNIENKKVAPGYSSHSHVVQCARQMLGHMHRQSFALGLVLCHGEWSLVILEKDYSAVPQCIKFRLYNDSMRGTNESLKIESLKRLFHWIYAILAWKTL